MSRHLRLDLDVPSEGVLDGLSIGDEVVAMVTGRVTMIRAAEPPEDGFDGFPPRIEIDVDGTKVRKREINPFEQMSIEDDKGAN